MTVALNYYTLAIAAGTTTPQVIGGEMDWKYEANQVRRWTVQLANGADSLLLEATLDGTNWFSVNAAITGTTAIQSGTITGPIRQFRATKTGTNGAATVTAMI